MVQLVVEGLKSNLNVREVGDPPCRFPDRARNVDLSGERVSVESAALVTLRNVGQTVSRFEYELFEDFHTSSMIQEG